MKRGDLSPSQAPADNNGYVKSGVSAPIRRPALAPTRPSPAEGATTTTSTPRVPAVRRGDASTATIGDKVGYVTSQTQTRNHTCHWPGCETQVPPAMYMCTPHWFALPKALRQRVWRAYVPGQETTMSPSAEYVTVAREVQAWIAQR